MRITFQHDRVLAVMAHPDDAELLCAGTLARARADGAAIAICVMCRGDKGAGSATGVRTGDVVPATEKVVSSFLLSCWASVTSVAIRLEAWTR